MLTFGACMRKGAEQRPQAFGRYFERNAQGEAIASCALAAALEGLYGPAALGLEALGTVAVLHREFPWVLGRRHWCPQRGCRRRDPIRRCALSQIGHLNDYHRWSREAIAAWLDTVDPTQ